MRIWRNSLFEAVVADGRRAGEVIRGIRRMVRKGEENRSPVNLNEVIAQDGGAYVYFSLPVFTESQCIV